jgi:hypothetical protein
MLPLLLLLVLSMGRCICLAASWQAICINTKA